MSTMVSGSSCSIDQVKNSIFHQERLLSKKMYQGIAETPLYALQQVKAGKNVRNSENSNTVFTRNAARGIVGFKDVDTSVSPMEEDTVTAKGQCGEGNIQMGSLVNPTDANACEGADVVDFAHGHYFRGYANFKLELRTPIRCIEQMANYEKEDIYRIQTDEVKEFKQTAIDSLDFQLTKYIIEKGEANGSCQDVLSEPIPILTANGWHKKPNRHVSIPYLEAYADELDRRMISNNDIAFHEMGNTKHTFELTREAWALAKMYDKLKRSSDGGIAQGVGGNIRLTADLNSINAEKFGEGAFKGRQYETWKNLTIIFNDFPIRGFLKPAGFTQDNKPKFTFMRIKHLKNVRADDEGSNIGIINGGVISVKNDDYYNDYIYSEECAGGTERVLELIPCVKEGSFTRHARYAGVAPAGVNPAGVNAEVNLLEGKALSSAENPHLFNNKYLYSLRMLIRIKDITPEYAGYIIHLRQFMPLYDIPVSTDQRRNQEDISRSTVQPVEDAPHATNADPLCDEAVVCATDTNRTVLDPCGDIAVNLFEERILKINVLRDALCSSGIAQVDYAVTALANDEGNSSVDGTHWDVVDVDGNDIASTGNIDWAAEESGCKVIYIKLISALADLAGEPQLTKFKVVIGGVTQTETTVDCDTATVSVSNFLG